MNTYKEKICFPSITEFCLFLFSITEAVERFNANVPYSGLLHAVSAQGVFAENKEKLISACLSLIILRGKQAVSTHNSPVNAQGEGNAMPLSATLHFFFLTLQ